MVVARSLARRQSLGGYSHASSEALEPGPMPPMPISAMDMNAGFDSILVAMEEDGALDLLWLFVLVVYTAGIVC